MRGRDFVATRCNAVVVYAVVEISEDAKKPADLVERALFRLAGRPESIAVVRGAGINGRDALIITFKDSHVAIVCYDPECPGDLKTLAIFSAEKAIQKKMQERKQDSQCRPDAV